MFSQDNGVRNYDNDPSGCSLIAVVTLVAVLFIIAVLLMEAGI